MNQFLAMAVRALSRQGVDITYTHVTTGTYDVNQGSSTPSGSSTTVKSYPKHVVANQYNYPNLIGKSLREFYIVGTALSTPPKPTDKITFNSEVYTVIKYTEHIAGGQVALYKILAVKQ